MSAVATRRGGERQWLRDLTAADRSDARVPFPRAGAPRFGRKLVVAGAMLVASVAVALAVIAVALKLFMRFVAPVIDYGLELLWPVLLDPNGPILLAAVLLVVGLPLARRFRQPRRFASGIVVVALALATFWPMQSVVARFQLRFWEYKAFLHGLALFITACIFTGGLNLIASANSVPEDDSWGFLE